MSLSIIENKNSIWKEYKNVIDGECDSWVLYSYIPNSKDELEVVSTGDGGLEELEQEFQPHRIMYALIKVEDPKTTLPKNVFINWQGESVNGIMRGRAANHVGDFKRIFKGITLEIHARNEDDVDPELIMAEVVRAATTNYNFKERPISQSEDLSNITPVGTNYTPIKPQQAIAPANERQKFWGQQHQEEQKRLQEEEQAKKLKQEQAEAELKQQELESQKRRAKENKRKALELAKLEKPQDREVNDGPIVKTFTPKNRHGSGSSSGYSTGINSLASRFENSASIANASKTSPKSSNNQTNSSVNSISSKFENSTQNTQNSANNSASTQSNPSTSSQTQISPKSTQNILNRPTYQHSYTPNNAIHTLQTHLNLNQTIQNNANKANSTDSAFSSNLSTTNSNSHASSINHVQTSSVNSVASKFNNLSSDNTASSNNSTNLVNNLHNHSSSSVSTTISTNNNATKSPTTTSGISPRSNLSSTHNFSANPFKQGQNTVKSVQPVQVNTTLTAGNSTNLNSYVSPVVSQEVSNHANDSSENVTSQIKAKALYDYDADDDTEISFLPGDIIIDIDQFDEGWWTGRAPDGKIGMFPANYVELI